MLTGMSEQDWDVVAGFSGGAITPWRQGAR